MIAEDLRPNPELRGTGPIAEWYKGQSIFITGATGFMGKVLLEKLLFQCNGIKNIYILARSKRGKTPHERLQDMWKLPVFERLRKHEPDALKKIVPLIGDCLTDNLGLTEDDRNLIRENVSIVFHCAATLKLEAKLKDAIEHNTAGTEKVLQLAKEIKNLKAFVHLSTAFCSADLPEFKEKVYRTAENPGEIIQVAKWIKDDALEVATPLTIHPHPNTYTYTKRLAETLVADEYPHLPVVIARPSIVTPAVMEPVPGWVDSLNGPMGIMIAAGKGVIRSMLVKSDSRGQVVPVDIAINALIVIAWKIGSAKERPPEIPVYNMTTDPVIKITWGEVLTMGKKIAYECPFEGQIWYPDGDLRLSKFVHQLCCFFFHWIPAYLIDFLMLILGQKRFMVRLMRRIDDGLQLLQFFTTRDWSFESKNFFALTTDITPVERKLYSMDFEIIPIYEYLTVCVLGARQYIMKEDLSTIPRCRRIQFVLYLVDRSFKLAFYLGLIWILYCCSESVQNIFDCVGTVLQRFPFLGFFIPNNKSL
ncbi:hypothetical protein PPYR_10061 [Photinus pyralis]|uniref:Fatty acyl-CoA reductase n=1 Tax=Photinus pyralis TaxID=7054 RepID=A0A1Y1KTF8_PHOPY|nr:putative fatty acyl-CoA reductase CG5065 [Photinus pyralis]KAB0796000.1 hypothetical protein PPYR_10061 [Photinus pyralis]